MTSLTFILLISLLALSVIAAWLFSAYFRTYALSKQIIDTPNHRSSHLIPTPRGGGLSFVVVFLLGVVALNQLHLISTSMSLALILNGFCLALIGYWDDIRPIKAKWRILFQLGIAISVVICMHHMPVLMFYHLSLSPGWLANGLAIVYILWLINLYNFMDGIDGLASFEVISVCLSMAILFYYNTACSSMWLVLLLAASVSGFAVWNVPRAKLFMGDVGSGFLGLMCAMLSIYAAYIKPAYFWCWLIMLGVFIVDATLTLLKRLVQGKNLYEAHRTHAYQHAARYYANHMTVTLAVCLINLIWLLPIALLVGFNHLDGLFGLLIAYLPLGILATRFKAGISAPDF